MWLSHMNERLNTLSCLMSQLSRKWKQTKPILDAKMLFLDKLIVNGLPVSVINRINGQCILIKTSGFFRYQSIFCRLFPFQN